MPNRPDWRAGFGARNYGGGGGANCRSVWITSMQNKCTYDKAGSLLSSPWGWGGQKRHEGSERGASSQRSVAGNIMRVGRLRDGSVDGEMHVLFLVESSRSTVQVSPFIKLLATFCE